MGESELELAQLLCTRLCHDLAGPIGAVAAGVELIASDPAAADPETLSLIGSSSNAAALKLRFLRAVLGTDAGAVNGTALDLSGLLDGYLGATTTAEAKPAVRWPPLAALGPLGQAIGPRWRQAVLNLCLAALEMQPGCREMEVGLAANDSPGKKGLTLTVDARGNPARTLASRADLETALTGTSSDPLNPKTVHAFFAGRIIRAVGGSIRVERGAGAVAVVVSF